MQKSWIVAILELFGAAEAAETDSIIIIKDYKLLAL
jgi:hypothetical protein